MEKFAAAKHRFIPGLLTALFLLFFCAPRLAAKNYATYEYVRSLSFMKADEYFFTASECTYYLDIKYVSPENVIVYVNNLPAHVSLISCKKEVLLPDPDTDDDPGTHVIMKLSFSQPGSYKINSIDVIVKGSYYRLPFERVEVMENPRYLMPALSVDFDENHPVSAKNVVTAKVGEHLNFTLNIRYAVQVTNISWIVPENSLFRELESFEASDSTVVRSEFSPDTLPLISFDWQPLKAGRYEFPQVSIVASSYSGSLTELELPPVTFRVVENPQQELPVEDEKKAAYAYAFDDQWSEDVEAFIEMEPYAVMELHKLRGRERHSFPLLNGVREERLRLERKYDLKNIEDETSLPFTIILCIFSFIILVLSVLLFVIKKYFTASAVLVAGLVFSVLSMILLFSTSAHHGIFKGGTLRPVPEISVMASSHLKAGTLVTVKQRAADWLYIRHNETYGWIPADSVLEVK